MSESDENLDEAEALLRTAQDLGFDRLHQRKAAECSKAGCSAYASHIVTPSGTPSGQEREQCSLCERHSIAWTSALGDERCGYRLAELSMDVELHALHGPSALRGDAQGAARKLMSAELVYEKALIAWLSKDDSDWQPGDKVWYEPSDGIRFAGVVTGPGTLDGCVSVFLGWVYFQWKGLTREGEATAIAAAALSPREGTQQVDERLRMHEAGEADPGTE